MIFGYLWKVFKTAVLILVGSAEWMRKDPNYPLGIKDVLIKLIIKVFNALN